MTAMQTNLMQCAVCGLSTDRLTPTPSTSAAMLAACALNFFGQPWQGLFWMEPVLLNRFMVLATVLQLSFHLYVEQQYFF